MKNKFRFDLAFVLMALVCAIPVLAQKNAAKERGTIFAVINDGVTLEPIAFVENGKLVSTGDGSVEPADLAKMFYKTGTKYDLIFGGVQNGTATITKSNVGTECGGSSADVKVTSDKARLKGFVMGLVTNIKPTAKAAGLRRMPTAGEKTEIEGLVRAEYARHKVPAAAYKLLHYYNLTAVDVDNDGIPEMIGSYWVAPTTKTRGLLFFIAEKKASGKYGFTYSDYAAIKPSDLMSGDLKDLDTMGGELLVDLFDVDNDGTAEIFAIEKAFEGNNYHVYKRSGGKWTKEFETYDYRCGY